ncbi:MAG: ABC transporter permease subunit [Lachnospiraceae bacterium]|nr:ABC transporter permease subunit [Lachnospiraceae bacterium]
MDYKKILQRTGAILFALALWQAAAMLINQRILLVSPVDVLLRLTTIWQTEGFFASIGFTFLRITAGFFAGLFLGILLSFAAARFEWIEILLWPFVVTFKTVPVASFVVICLIWLSAGNLSIFISFLVVFPIVYQNLLAGLKAKDPRMEEMASIFGMRGFAKLKAITLEAIKPQLISACSIGAGMAWKAGVAAEVIGTPNGSIGKQLYLSKIYLDTDDLLAWTVILVLISVLFEKAFIWAIKKLLR